MAKLKNDELNIVSYEQYFGEMEISEKEKQDRIKLAYEFEEYLVWLFLALAAETWTLEEYYRMADEKYCQIAAKYMGVKEIPAYITDYAAEITMSIVDTTLNNKEVDYYLSDERAKAIAANEANSIGNYREQVEMVKQGYKYKQWLTMKDNRVRHTHVQVDDTKIGIFDHFLVGDSEMMFPKDTSLGAEPEEIVNCRCSLRYTKD
ncbi:hypothetical protein DWZ16_11070 [Clostridium sp. AF29-8BH]|jgi:hypothetical protein|uniref:phage minor head protein n=1 Tax=Clostridium sp. AF29-8BH TaxID=2293009 RepID=UPI000E4DD80C|nr:hypothetical protein DWZ16_11070 [Clostridium sp. AF29-8BH]